ncbi:MAG: DUF1642 domain-containing protein [Staphylococcus equorum]|nr:DUF1642 domain-containing protein [Lactococcus lactis]MDN6570113.1 DUF1642 domain-containing protein [Staphylococcus equorum]MDN6724476.1 DUF1642 domain-containing protein [Tetragenococcus halophilus]MDN6504888.1 DUF1642 domain-containing protein [Lactococcus lactis]MDN6612169.1 DUF1642 domain-containing protein [Staphylococcus equorum]
MYNATFREKPKRTNAPMQPINGEKKMTKFEEELRKIKPRKKFLEFNAGITYWYCLSDLIQKFGNWHSDEEFQKVVEKGGSFSLANKNLIDDNTKLVKEIAVLKAQLPQKYLPVVPEEVAEFITKVKKAGNNLTFAFNSKFDECPAKYWNEAIVWRLNHPEEFALAFITGNYQIEKPKLFYLRNKLTGMYLYKKPLCGYGEDSANYIKDLTNDFKFTQKEIDGMDIQSYDKKDEYKGE